MNLPIRPSKLRFWLVFAGVGAVFAGLVLALGVNAIAALDEIGVAW